MKWRDMSLSEIFFYSFNINQKINCCLLKWGLKVKCQIQIAEKIKCIKQQVTGILK